MSGAASSLDTPASGLPEILPIFPLAGCVLLPRAHLPLNIFEARYVAMVEDALGKGRLIGVVQPSAHDGREMPPLYHVGCAGRISQFAETDDGRFLMTLTGVSRFRVLESLVAPRGYRTVRADWSNFLDDIGPAETTVIDREALVRALETFCKTHDITMDWKALHATPDDIMVSTLAMMCPLEPSEKQALVEAPTLSARARTLTALLSMDCVPGADNDKVVH